MDSFDHLPAIGGRLSKRGFVKEVDEKGAMTGGYGVTYRKGSGGLKTPTAA